MESTFPQTVGVFPASLWDCLALIDDATVDPLKGLAGVAAIAVSHPHDDTTGWSCALGGVPIQLHAADRQWVMRADPAGRFWKGDAKTVAPARTLLGGHFDGGSVLHWAD